jgi:hypothetical protein
MQSRISPGRWALAGFAVVSLGWASYLQARFTMLDACYANGDAGANETHLSVLLSVLVGVVAGVAAKRMRGWGAALTAALLTPVAFLVLSWCLGNASFSLIRAVHCPDEPSNEEQLLQSCGICRPPRPDPDAKPEVRP